VASFPLIQQLPELINFVGGELSLLNQMFHQWHGLTTKQQINHFADGFADHRLRSHFWRVHAIATFESGVQISLVFQTTEVRLDRGKIDITTSRQRFEDLPNSCVLQIPDNAGNLQLGRIDEVFDLPKWIERLQAHRATSLLVTPYEPHAQCWRPRSAKSDKNEPLDAKVKAVLVVWPIQSAGDESLSSGDPTYGRAFDWKWLELATGLAPAFISSVCLR